MPRAPKAVLLAFVVATATAAGAADLADFARCLRRAGATFYTASWCPHCARQARMFGAAVRYLRTVDCTDGCDGIRSLPTWTFADGSTLSGVASLEELARRTRCRSGGSGDDGADRTSASAAGGVRERWVGGVKIIEIPAR